MAVVETDPAWSPEERVRRLEAGEVLFFPESPVRLSPEDLEFLRGQRQSAGRIHKNIAYRPGPRKVTGTAGLSGLDRRRLTEVLARFSEEVVRFVQDFLSPYQGQWRRDYASFRPLEEAGRQIRLRARNDLLHIDSFPTRPTRGDRILRFFINISPSQARHWIISQPLDRILPSLPPEDIRSRLPGWKRNLRNFLSFFRAEAAGWLGSPYDEVMLALHHYMKEHPEFQASCPKFPFHFPPGSAWMVYTDFVPHAALSGRFALEQTFVVSRQAQLLPEKAPLHILQAAGFL